MTRFIVETPTDGRNVVADDRWLSVVVGDGDARESQNGNASASQGSVAFDDDASHHNRCSNIESTKTAAIAKCCIVADDNRRQFNVPYSMFLSER